MKMNRGYLAAATVAFLLPICVAAVADDDADASKTKALQDTAKAWAKAIEDKDKAAMSLILANDFLNVGADGKTSGKEATIKALAAGNLTLGVEKRDNEKTRVYQDTAVMTARSVVTIAIDGKRGTL